MIAECEALREQVKAALVREFEGVWEQVVSAPGATAAEQRVQAWVREVGRQVLEAGLQAAIEQRERAPQECCGVRMERHARERREVLTVLGLVRIRRRYLRCPRCRAHQRPTDAWLGWRGGFSPAVEELVAWECAALPYREGLASLEKLAGLAVSVEAAEGIVAHWGATPLALAPQAEPIRQDAVVEIDGTTVFIEEQWREVKLGTFFAWDRPQEAARRRLPAEHAPPPQAPQARSYVAKCEPAAHFSETLWQEALVRGTATARSVAVLGDGAAWIWNLADTLFPRATQILDWYHLTEHLWKAAKVVHGEGTTPTERLAKRWETEVWEGRSEGVEEHLRELVREGRDDRDQTLRKGADYLQTHQHRIRYPLFREMGWPVASGVVEAGCKQVIGMRMKRKSTRWSEPGAEAVLRLRVDRLSNRWPQRLAHVRRAA
jgi:hypothetical protein